MGLEGRIFSGEYIGRKYTPGVTYKYTGYVSEYYKANEPAALLIMFDYLNKVQAAAMEELVGKGMAPAFVAIGIEPGTIKPVKTNSAERFLRTDFNHTGPEIPYLVIKELVPDIITRESLNISRDPDMHMTSGGSTGGAIAFNFCWYANDGFHRCYLSSPSVHSLSGGAELVNYATKCEPRPIKSYVSSGKYESLGYWGHNYEAALSLVRCFYWNNYDYCFQYLDEKVHTWGMGDYNEQLRAMEWIWKNWNTEPVRTGEYSKTVRKFVYKDSPWQEIAASEMPKESEVGTSVGIYKAVNETIRLITNEEDIKVAEGFGKISGLSVSCDQGFLYITDVMRREVFVMTIMEDGTLTNLRTLSCMIHINAMASRLGASGLCSDAADNLYLATEWGIQITPAAGNLSTILPLPEDLPADEVSLESNLLYVRSGKRYFKRVISQHSKVSGKVTEAEDAGERAMDFGQWTEAFQPRIDELTEDERNIFLRENTFFSTHPAYLGKN